MGFPLIHILFYSFPLSLTFDPILVKVVSGALVQSILSTVITLAGGLAGAFGLLSYSVRWRPTTFRALTLFIAAPSFFPPLIVVLLGSFSFGFLPMGLWGVVFFHTLMNIGLVAVLLFQTLRDKSQNFLREALVWGVAPRYFIVCGLLPEIRHDLKVIFYYLMVLYFFSFSIPMLVGGPLYGGIEVFIYEKIMHFGEWGEAILYSLGLFVLLALASRLVGKATAVDGPPGYLNRTTLQWLGIRPLISLALIPSVYLFIVLLIATFQFFTAFSAENIASLVHGTLIIGLSTGLLLFVLFSLLSFSFLEKHFSRFLLAMISPGWVIVAFSLLLLGGQSDGWSLTKIAIALAILYLPYLFRLSFYQKIKDLSTQVRLAQTFPVSWTKIFLQIIWPQCLPTLCFLSGVGALWACGDFAVSGILMSSAQVNTLALEMKNLLTAYRVEQAILLFLPLLLTSLVVFMIFWGLGLASGKRRWR